MSIEVETLVAVSVMMAVFSAVTAVGTSIILSVGFKRLNAGFEVINKQAGFFSDAIYRLENKMEAVDDKADNSGDNIAAVHDYAHYSYMHATDAHQGSAKYN